MMNPISSRNITAWKNILRIYLYFVPLALYLLGFISLAGVFLSFIASLITLPAFNTASGANDLDSLTKFILFLAINTMIWFF